MRRSLLALLLIVLPGSLTAQNRPEFDRAAIQREVEGRTRAMSQAFQRGDLRTVARFYADDARLYASGTRIEGRAEIDRFWEKVRNPSSWVMETVDVGGSRDEPYQLVRSTLVERARGHADTSFTMCLLVWRREADGQLRIRLDVWANYPHEFELSQFIRRPRGMP